MTLGNMLGFPYYIEPHMRWEGFWWSLEQWWWALTGRFKSSRNWLKDVLTYGVYGLFWMFS